MDKDLSVIFGDDYYITDAISIHQPTLRDIKEMGEGKYFQAVFTLTCIPSDMKYRLFKMGLDYEEVEDFDLFMLMAPTLESDISQSLFMGVDLSKFEICQNQNNGDLVLADLKNDIMIDKLAYLKICDYFRSLHGLKPKVEKAGNEDTKKILIEEDKMRYEMNQDKDFEPILLPLIISMVNTEEFKYDYQTVQDLNIAAFMASVEQIQKKKQAIALLQGCYSGMIDTSKIKTEDINWIK